MGDRWALACSVTSGHYVIVWPLDESLLVEPKSREPFFAPRGGFCVFCEGNVRLMQASLQWVAQYGYVAIFALLVLGIVGLPVPDEWLLTFAGYLICKGKLQPLPTIAAASLGSMCGISLSYGLGRTLGLYLVRKYGRFLHITPERLNRVHNWFERVGRWTLLVGYYVPGVRHLTAYVAGASKLELPVFALFAYSGGFIWSLTFISLGYFLCDKWAAVTEKIQRNFLISLTFLLILLLAYFFLRRKGPNLH